MEYILSYMETLRLRHFKTVVEAGGLMKANELLGITGGGLSKSIKALEEELGLELFQQKGRGLELTEIGEEFYRRIPAALKVIDDLVELKEIKKEKEQVIKFASFEVFTTYFLGEFISDYLSSEIVEVREAIPGKMEQLVANGSSDFGITYEPIPCKGIEFLKVSKIKMGIYTNSKSQLHKSDVMQIPFVVPIAPLQGAPSGVKGLDGWPDHLFERNIQFRVEMMETALQLTRKGVAASFIPNFVADAFNSQGLNSGNLLSEVKLPKGLKNIVRDVFIIKRKNSEEGSITKKLAKVLRQISS